MNESEGSRLQYQIGVIKV